MRPTITQPSQSSARRIVHVIPSLGLGGCERQLADLIRHSDRARYTHSIAHLGPPNNLIEELGGAVEDVRDISRTARRGPLRGPRALRATFLELEPDVVHSWLFEADIAARVASAGLGCGHLTSLATPAYDRVATVAAEWPAHSVLARRTLDGVTARMVDPLFVACSQFVARSTAAALHLRRDRLRVIPNSVDPARLAPKPGGGSGKRAQLGLSQDRFVVLAMGRLDLGKGLDVLIRATDRLRADVPELAVVILGEGPRRETLENLVDTLGLGATVQLPGSSLDVAGHLAMADAFAFPSRFEGFGMALAEAMAVGLPCVTTTLPPVLEFAKPEVDVLGVDADDIEALVAQLRRLARDPALRHRLGHAAKSTVAHRLDIRVTGPQWEAAYAAELARRA